MLLSTGLSIAFFCGLTFVFLSKYYQDFPDNVIMAGSDFVIKAKNRSFLGFEKDGESSKWNGSFYFIQGADPQFGFIDAKLETPTDTWEEEIALVKQTVKAVNNLEPRPKFFVVCGDLVHDFPGGKFRKEQEQDFIRLFGELQPDIPLVCLCGNHDIGDIPTAISIKTYTDKFGDDYFTFFVGGVMFIALNSQFYENRTLVEDLAKQQDDWLDIQLTEAKTGGYKHVVVFQHIPWFVQEPEEKRMYFNIERELRMKMIQKFHTAGVSAIFCGHYHRNAGGFYKNMELVVTSAIGKQLGQDKSGIRIVKVLNDAIKHEYFALDDVPKTVDLL